MGVQLTDGNSQINRDVHGNRGGTTARAIRTCSGSTPTCRQICVYTEDKRCQDFTAALPHGSTARSDDCGVGYPGIDRTHNRIGCESVQSGDQGSEAINVR